MTPNVFNGIMLLIALGLIVAGVVARWGWGWALIVWGVLLLLRVVLPPIYALFVREPRDA